MKGERERPDRRWAAALLLALLSNLLLLVAILLMSSGVVFVKSKEELSLAEPSHGSDHGFPCGDRGDLDSNTESVRRDGLQRGLSGKDNPLHTSSQSRKSQFPNNDPKKWDLALKGVFSTESEESFHSRDELVAFIKSNVRTLVLDQNFVDTILNSVVDSFVPSLMKAQTRIHKEQPNAPNLLQLVTDLLQSQDNANKPSSPSHGLGLLRTLLSTPLRKKEGKGGKDRKRRPKMFRGGAWMLHEGGEEANGTLARAAQAEFKTSRRKRDASREDPEEPQDDSNRRSDLTPEQYYSTELILEEVFSGLTDQEVTTQPEPVQKVLVPALIHFEGMVIRQLESLSATVISLDHRLEELEKEQLNRARQQSHQADGALENRTGEGGVQQIIEEDFIPVNTTGATGIKVIEGEGSGDSVEDQPTTNATTPTTTMTTTTTTTTTTTLANQYEMFRDVAELEQKVQALENYNIMSDRELQRTRSEVIKMDDKVAELVRKHRNLLVRTSTQTYRLTELEVFTSKAELALHTTLSAFSRLGQRFQGFKDRMAEYKNDVRDVRSQFARTDQIMSELRSADSYKAHDINELRESLLNLEERLNGLYRVMDQSVDTMRSDVRDIMERMCTANGLSC